MKKLIFYIILTSISITSLFCHEYVSINVKEAVEQHIITNDLPITIGEEIIIANYINKTDRINFQIFLLDLFYTINDLFNNSFRHSINFDEIFENYIEIIRIYAYFYNYCKNNNYELAIIVFGNEFDFLVEYLEYHNYKITYHHNNWVSLDNNTENVELHNLINMLLQISDISRNNIMNKICYNWGGPGGYIYGKNTFTDGKIETINLDIESLDIAFERRLLWNSYSIIGDILFLLITRNYINREYYEEFWYEIIKKNMEHETVWGNVEYELMKNYLNDRME
jgi:hypothetical protein